MPVAFDSAFALFFKRRPSFEWFRLLSLPGWEFTNLSIEFWTFERRLMDFLPPLKIRSPISVYSFPYCDVTLVSHRNFRLFSIWELPDDNFPVFLGGHLTQGKLIFWYFAVGILYSTSGTGKVFNALDTGLVDFVCMILLLRSTGQRRCRRIRRES